MVRFFCIAFCLVALGNWATADLYIDNQVQTYVSLSGTVVYMTATSELHLTSAATPLSGCTVHLNSVNAWLFLEGVKPSAVNTSAYLNQIRVSGAAAALNTNVRIVEYGAGTVVIPHSSTFQPLRVFTDDNFKGSSANLSQYTAYNTSSLGTMANAISSFILKRGYTATFAQNQDGTGYGKNYVAQDCDLEIAVLPTKLDDKINFVRVFPWRWVSKKGACDDWPLDLNPGWWYDWGSGTSSTQDNQYVAMRHHEYNGGWDSLNRNWGANGVNHLLGHNEPDKTDQANMTVSEVLSVWPNLLATGLRLGSPATSDGGRNSWLYPFVAAADDSDLRVDFVSVHYYWCYNPTDPSGAATQMYNFLKDVHDNTGRPIWVTEWNNGANWTGCTDPTYEQNRVLVEAMMNMMDSTPWIERYAIFSRVEWMRQTHYDTGGLTPMGQMYRDQIAPLSYRQEVPASGKNTDAIYSFETNFRDSSGNGNNPLVYGAPKRQASPRGNALVLDGADDYLILPATMGQDADFTFAAWVNWDGGAQWQRIFDFGNDTNQYLFLTPGSGNNTLRFAIKNGGSEQIVETATQLAAGTWVHVAVTLNGNTGTLYVNGTPAATSNSITINPSDFQPAVNYIGKSQWPDPLFDGMLDDVFVAGRALSGAQISELYTDSVPGRFVTVPLNIVASSAGAEETGNPAVNSYDRNRQTRWANDNTVANAWIQYDLGAVYPVDRIRVRFHNGDLRTHPIRITVDGVQVFNGNTTTTSGYWQTSFTPVSGRYVQITMTGSNSAGSNWLSIWETQVYSSGLSLPYTGTPAALPGRIEAEYFDNGLQDNACRDTTSGNSGGQLRSDTDVDIRSISDGGSGYAITQIASGEWLRYTINVTQSDTYNLLLRASATTSGLPVNIWLNDTPLGTIVVDSTGSTDTFVTFGLQNVALAAGNNQDLRLEFAAGGLDVNWIEVAKPGPYGATAAALPGTIEAEKFDTGGPYSAYYDTTGGNSGGAFRTSEDVDIVSITDSWGSGYAVDNIQTGEWLVYTVDSSASSAGLYARVASTQAGGQIIVTLDGEPLGMIDVPNTGSLTTWQTVSIPSVTLPTKSNVPLKIEFVGTNFRLNWIALQNRLPYLGAPFELPGTIQAVDYDIGGQSISYYDATGGNNYANYRTDDVDIYHFVHTGYIVYTAATEWLEYTCNIQPGYYTLTVRSGAANNQALEISIDGTPLTTVNLPNTGSLDIMQDASVSNVYLAGGSGQIVRLAAGGNRMLKSVTLTRQYNVADIDQSGVVDLSDLVILSSQWLMAPGSPSADIAPTPSDGIVDSLDLLMLAENWLMFN